MIRFQTLKWVPNPTRGEFVNIALIAWSEEHGAQFDVQQSNLERANRLGVIPDDFQDWINTKIQPVADASPEERTAIATKQFQDSRNLLQFGVPMPSAYDSAGKLLRDIFPLLVGDD